MTATTRTLRVGTRASALARTQTDLVAGAIGTPVEIVPIVTAGDRSSAAVTQLGGTGVFVSALRDALLAGEIDVAVHSYKDLPTAPAEGITIAAIPLREDPRDALVARDGLTLGELPAGARVGTGSPRRAAQLRALGLGLDVVPLRGNVDTRLGKVIAGELDAVVLAYAGLRRLGRTAEVTEVLDPIQVLPAPAQGALAVECRTSDEGVLAALAALDDADTRSAVTAERALLAALEAGCSAPVGALAVVAEDEDGASELFLRAAVIAADGSDAVRLSATGATTDAEGVGRRLAAELLAEGADHMMNTAAAPLASGQDMESSS
jgi:hydroxymethylbilane synthase